MNDEVKAIPIIESINSYESNNFSPLKMLNVEKMWDKGIRGKGINIAVLDSGCSSENPDFKDRILTGVNFTNEDKGDFNNYNDYNGHGTHVSGLISSNNINNSISIAPESNLLIVKVLDIEGNGKIEHLINGIYYAVNWRGENNERIRIICMSLGTSEDRSELHDSIKFATSYGVSVVVASGNDGNGDFTNVNMRYPGVYNEVIQVGSVNSKLKISNFSNVNNQMDILAPGENINSLYLNNQFKKLSGTSMAAPFIAGGLALIMQDIELELGRNLTWIESYAQLMKRTKSLGYIFKVEGNGILYF